MKIRILCVGKIKEEFYRKQLAEYQKSINKYCQFEIIEVEDEKTMERLSETERNRILKIEGERLNKYLMDNPGELIVALCIEGKKFSSEEWNQKLKNWIQQRELQQVTYIIGGSLGLDSDIVRKADVKLSFSNLTFPHQLMRVMLTEQILAGYL